MARGELALPWPAAGAVTARATKVLSDEARPASAVCTTPAPASVLLSVQNLQVEFHTARGVLRAVDGVSWDVRPGEVLALVGESGCGKSVTALSILQLLPKPAARIVGGCVRFEGRDLLALQPDEMRALRGRSIGMVFQEPMSSLNPVLSIGLQIEEPLLQHLGLAPKAARARALELLNEVGITDAERRLAQYPHQLSGGMRQRVMIAIALACKPKLLIADEPTTALDVTIQAQILDLMQRLCRRLGIALVLITHNLGIVARYADRVSVMYAGRIVEAGTVQVLFAQPHHPYTRGLLASVPRLDEARRLRLATIPGLPPNLLQPPAGCRFAARCTWRLSVCDDDPALRPLAGSTVACHRAEEVAAAGADARQAPGLQAAPSTQPLLELRSVSKSFDLGRKGRVHAVQSLSLDVRAGETVGLVGESGCGKTTVGRLVVGLETPTEGHLRFQGEDVQAGGQSIRRRMQIVFQDPYSSLNPRMTIGQTLEEPLRVHRLVPGARVTSRMHELLGQVGLDTAMAARYPHQLSGGQRQRVSIARALAMEPTFIVLDEPVSALDVCVQAQVINLLDELQSRLGLAYLFIAHDLAVVRHLAHRVVVMYLGRVMESGPRDALYQEPLHPYTIALLSAAPVPDPALRGPAAQGLLGGELPSPLAPPSGCVFRTRCPLAGPECADNVPELREVRPGRRVACIKVAQAC